MFLEIQKSKYLHALVSTLLTEWHGPPVSQEKVRRRFFTDNWKSFYNFSFSLNVLRVAEHGVSCTTV